MAISFYRIKKYYPFWFILWGLVIWVLVSQNLSQFIFWMVIWFLIKDIAIDLGFLGLTKRYGSFPEWFEHAPFLILVVILGIAGSPAITLATLILASIDLFFDLADDLRII